MDLNEIIDVNGDGKGVSVIKFYGDYCNPCKMLENTMKEVIKEKNVGYFSLNVDSNYEICEKLKISSVPTLMFFKDKKLYETIKGNISYDTIIGIIERGEKF